MTSWVIEGLGPFYIGQIIADLKYVEPLKSAKDWWTYCVPGPGSQRGLNRKQRCSGKE
jgi:hypothetical protein